MLEKIKKFLRANGWDYVAENGEYIAYDKIGVCGVDLSIDEIVFICEEGDTLHIPLSAGWAAYYAMIGYMLSNGFLCVNYKRI